MYPGYDAPCAHASCCIGFAEGGRRSRGAAKTCLTAPLVLAAFLDLSCSAGRASAEPPAWAWPKADALVSFARWTSGAPAARRIGSKAGQSQKRCHQDSPGGPQYGPPATQVQATAWSWTTAPTTTKIAAWSGGLWRPNVRRVASPPPGPWRTPAGVGSLRPTAQRANCPARRRRAHVTAPPAAPGAARRSRRMCG